MSDRGSESESPAIPSPTPTAHRPMSNRDWWPNQLTSRFYTSTRPCLIRWARASTTKRSSRPSTSTRSSRTSSSDDDVAGLVAGRLRHYGRSSSG